MKISRYFSGNIFIIGFLFLSPIILITIIYLVEHFKNALPYICIGLSAASLLSIFMFKEMRKPFKTVILILSLIFFTGGVILITK